MKVILPVAGKGEFQLTDALQMMIEQGCKFQIWAARHNSAVALYVVEPFRRQGDAPPLTTRSLLRNMGEGNTAKVCAPRGQMRLRHICLHSVMPSYAQVRTCRDARWGHDRCRGGERLSNPLVRKPSVSYKGVMEDTVYFPCL